MRETKADFAYSWQSQIAGKQPRKSSSTTKRLLLFRKFQKSNSQEKLCSRNKVWETSHVIIDGLAVNALTKARDTE